MDVKDILLFLKTGEPNAAILSLAAHLAREHGALVAGLCLYSEPEAPLSDGFAIGPDAVEDVLAHRDRKIRETVAPIEAAFRETLAIDGYSAGWSLSEPSEAPQDSALRARLFDVVMTHRPEPHDHAGRDLAETLVLAGGTPCLIVPEAGDGRNRFDRVLLAWNGSREAKRALDDGLGFLKRAAAVDVMIIDGEVVSPADEQAGEALLKHLSRHGVHARLQRVRQAHDDAGRTLLQSCATFAADLLIMGAYGHSRTAESILGGATRTVLTHAPIPVLMSH